MWQDNKLPYSLRSMHVKTVIIIEGLADLAMMLGKLVVGLHTNSAAIMGDALHSLTDLCNNIIALIALRISEKPSDEDHHYGHHKFEQLAVFALAVMLAVVAVELVINAFKNYGQVVEHSEIGLIVMIFTLLINIGMTAWEHYWARRLDSDLLHADAKHTLSDVLTTVAVIVGWQLASRGYAVIDTIVALLVAIIIFYMAVILFFSAVPVLVDSSLYKPEDMRRIVAGVDQVKTVEQIRSRSTRKGGSADVIVSVDAKLSTADAHAVADLIEKALHEHFGLEDVLVHVEPYQPKFDV